MRDWWPEAGSRERGRCLCVHTRHGSAECEAKRRSVDTSQAQGWRNRGTEPAYGARPMCRCSARRGPPVQPDAEVWPSPS